jgi:hypothetical protein
MEFVFEMLSSKTFYERQTINIQKVAALLHPSNFTIVDKDDACPWEGFFVIDEAQPARFAQNFYRILDLPMAVLYL